MYQLQKVAIQKSEYQVTMELTYIGTMFGEKNNLLCE